MSCLCCEHQKFRKFVREVPRVVLSGSIDKETHYWTGLPPHLTMVIDWAEQGDVCQHRAAQMINPGKVIENVNSSFSHLIGYTNRMQELIHCGV